jgi:hypothetical protein
MLNVGNLHSACTPSLSEPQGMVDFPCTDAGSAQLICARQDLDRLRCIACNHSAPNMAGITRYIIVRTVPYQGVAIRRVGLLLFPFHTSLLVPSQSVLRLNAGSPIAPPHTVWHPTTISESDIPFTNRHRHLNKGQKSRNPTPIYKK